MGMRRTAVEAHKKASATPVNSMLRHTAVRPAPEHDVMPHLQTSNMKRDFSQIRPQTTTPMTTPASQTTACPMFPRRCPFGGACHTCPVQVQTKLTINKPGDKYEQEADRIADQIMRMPDPDLQRQIEPKEFKEEEKEEPLQTKQIANQITPLMQREVEAEAEEEEQERSIQAKITTSPTPQVNPSLETTIHSLQGNGQPLPKATRDFFEPRFGYSFDQVRVHTNVQAAKSAQAINARAFTMGRDVVFGSGQFSPGTNNGQRLLAHELVHTIQQKGTTQIQRQGSKPVAQKPATPSAPQIDAFFVSKMTWLTLKLRDMVANAFDSLQLAHKTVGWGPEVAEFLLSSAAAGLGALIGGGVGAKIFYAILLSSSTSMLSSRIKPQNISISKLKTKVKDYINDYMLGPNYGVIAKLKAAKASDKNELNKVLSLLDQSKTPQIKKIAQEMAMSAFLVSSKGVLNIGYRAYGPDLSKFKGDLSGQSLKWYNAPGRHLRFHVPVLRYWLSSTGYTKGMTYLEKVYQGKKVKDAKIPNIRIGVSVRFGASKISASKDYYYCGRHHSKGNSVKGCKTTQHMVSYSFSYLRGKPHTCFLGLCNPVRNIKQSVVDHNIIWPDSWYNYYLKSSIADKAIAYALNETLPKPR